MKRGRQIRRPSNRRANACPYDCCYRHRSRNPNARAPQNSPERSRTRKTEKVGRNPPPYLFFQAYNAESSRIKASHRIYRGRQSLYYETEPCGNTLRSQAVFVHGWRLRAALHLPLRSTRWVSGCNQRVRCSIEGSRHPTHCRLTGHFGFMRCSIRGRGCLWCF